MVHFYHEPFALSFQTVQTLEILHHAAFHLGLHCLSKNLDRGVASLKFKKDTLVEQAECMPKRNIYKQHIPE